MAKNFEAVMLRMEPQIKAELAAQAKSQRRALSNYIMCLLTDHVEKSKKSARQANGTHTAKSQVAA